MYFSQFWRLWNPRKVRAFSGVSFIRTLIPFMRAPPSWPNHLPKAQGFQHRIWGDTNIQSIAYMLFCYSQPLTPHLKLDNFALPSAMYMSACFPRRFSTWLITVYFNAENSKHSILKTSTQLIEIHSVWSAETESRGLRKVYSKVLSTGRKFSTRFCHFSDSFCQEEFPPPGKNPSLRDNNWWQVRASFLFSSYLSYSSSSFFRTNAIFKWKNVFWLSFGPSSETFMKSTCC